MSTQNTKFIDEEEKKLIESISVEDYEEIDNVIPYYEEIASNQISKKKAISIRLYEADLQKVKSLSLKEWIPYQTLISSIIHKHVNAS